MWHSKTFTIIAVVCVVIFGIIAGIIMFNRPADNANEDISAAVSDIVTYSISESTIESTEPVTEPTVEYIVEPEIETEPITEPTVEYVAEPETTEGEETEPYIEETEPVMEPEETEPTESDIDQDALEMLAIVIYQEVGGDAACDECRYRVGDVVLNRVADPRFPNSIYEVLVQPGQYGRLSWTGIVWADRATNPGEAHAVARAYRVAEDLLRGNHSDLYGAGYVWQAGFVQGVDNIYCCGHYFGR